MSNEEYSNELNPIVYSERGANVVIPTCVDGGKQVSGKEAIARYKRSGEHLGKFMSLKEASDYARWLTDAQRVKCSKAFGGYEKEKRRELGADVLSSWSDCRRKPIEEEPTNFMSDFPGFFPFEKLEELLKRPLENGGIKPKGNMTVTVTMLKDKSKDGDNLI